MCNNQFKSLKLANIYWVCNMWSDKGKGDVLFIHGFISSSAFWTETLFPNFSHAAKSTYRLFAIDLLGFGRSPKPADSLYTLREHLDMIEQSVLEPYEVKSFHIVAHSLGCILALALAVKHPGSVKSLTLLAPVSSYFFSNVFFCCSFSTFQLSKKINHRIVQSFECIDYRLVYVIMAAILQSTKRCPSNTACDETSSSKACLATDHIWCIDSVLVWAHQQGNLPCHMQKSSVVGVPYQTSHKKQVNSHQTSTAL
jgi:hypothetical protein